MNELILYSIILEICEKNNFTLLRFFILDSMKKKFTKKKFYLILMLVKKNKKNKEFYNFLDNFIKNNYSKIINHYTK